jgi:flagellar biosynthesis/type III secretory pathway M-ring protein FliF/YscJ
VDPAAPIARWNALPKTVRTAVLSCAALAVAVSIAFGIVGRPSRAPLFLTALHSEQLAEVQERLAEWNVAFTPTADNILVDEKKKNALLLKLSLAGIPHEHVATEDEALAKLGALTPQAVIDAQTREGLAGDVELGLRGIDGVQDARVIIAPAKPGVFADETGRDASAGVRLSLVAGAHLSDEAISGIRSYVAASVPGLDERRVTIVDDRGVALGGASGGDDAADLQRSLQSALDAAIGVGVSIVRVHAEYDGRALQSSDVRRTTLGTTPISATLQDERYESSGKHYEKSAHQVERGSETRRITAAVQPGRLSRISAAVFVDATRGVDLYQLQTLAAATLGIDPRRGDRLTVSAVRFPHLRMPRRDWRLLFFDAAIPLLPTVIVCIAVLIALRAASAPAASLVRALTQRSALARTTAVVRGAAPAKIRGALIDEPAHTAAAIISALPTATAAAVLDMYPEQERSAIIRRMQRPATPLLEDVEKFIADA